MRTIHELKKRSQAPCAKLSVQYYIETSNSDWPTQDQDNVFQKKVNCFSNMSYQVHVIGLVMVTVLIGTTPSCICEDFMTSWTVKICKHLIWLYVVVLGVNEKDDTL